MNADQSRNFRDKKRTEHDAAVDAIIAMGMKTQGMDREVLLEFATMFFGRTFKQVSPPARLQGG